LKNPNDRGATPQGHHEAPDLQERSEYDQRVRGEPDGQLDSDAHSKKTTAWNTAPTWHRAGDPQAVAWMQHASAPQGYALPAGARSFDLPYQR
jgi:hypothetical protein